MFLLLFLSYVLRYLTKRPLLSHFIQFGFQEPGTNEEIKKFAAAKNFTGMLMDKINVNGSKASPVFQFLKVGSGDTGLITWNFAKFLVKKDGTGEHPHTILLFKSDLITHANEYLICLPFKRPYDDAARRKGVLCSNQYLFIIFYLISAAVAGRFGPKTNPMELVSQIEELLKE